MTFMLMKENLQFQNEQGFKYVLSLWEIKSFFSLTWPELGTAQPPAFSFKLLNQLHNNNTLPTRVEV